VTPLTPKAYKIEIHCNPSPTSSQGERIRWKLPNGDSPVTIIYSSTFIGPDKIGTDTIYEGAVTSRSWFDGIECG